MFTPNNLPDCNKRKCEECSFWSNVITTTNCEQHKKFMDGYAININFSQALEALKAGKKVRRSSWPAGHHLIYGIKEQYGSETLLIYSVDKNCSHCGRFTFDNIHIFAEDWEVVDDIPEMKTAKVYATSWFIDCPYCGSPINLKLSGDIYKCWNCEKDVKAIVEEDKHEKEVINKLKAELNEVIETMENEVCIYKEENLFFNAHEAEIKRRCFKWCIWKLEEFEKEES